MKGSKKNSKGLSSSSSLRPWPRAQWIGDASRIVGGHAYYDSIQVAVTKNKSYDLTIGDFVLLESHKSDPYIAQIQRLYENQSQGMLGGNGILDLNCVAIGQKWVEAKWFYRQYDIPPAVINRITSASALSTSDIFFSNHLDVNVVESIIGSCKVHFITSTDELQHDIPKNEYICKYRYISALTSTKGERLVRLRKSDIPSRSSSLTSSSSSFPSSLRDIQQDRESSGSRISIDKVNQSSSSSSPRLSQPVRYKISDVDEALSSTLSQAPSSVKSTTQSQSQSQHESQVRKTGTISREEAWKWLDTATSDPEVTGFMNMYERQHADVWRRSPQKSRKQVIRYLVGVWKKLSEKDKLNFIESDEDGNMKSPKTVFAASQHDKRPYDMTGDADTRHPTLANVPINKKSRSEGQASSRTDSSVTTASTPRQQSSISIGGASSQSASIENSVSALDRQLSRDKPLSGPWNPPSPPRCARKRIKNAISNGKSDLENDSDNEESSGALSKMKHKKFTGNKHPESANTSVSSSASSLSYSQPPLASHSISATSSSSSVSAQQVAKTSLSSPSPSTHKASLNKGESRQDAITIMSTGSGEGKDKKSGSLKSSGDKYNSKGSSWNKADGQKSVSSDSKREIEKAVASEAIPTPPIYSPHTTASGRKGSGSTARGYSSVALSSAATRRSTVGLFEENDISMDTSQGNSSQRKNSQGNASDRDGTKDKGSAEPIHATPAAASIDDIVALTGSSTSSSRRWKFAWIPDSTDRPLPDSRAKVAGKRAVKEISQKTTLSSTSKTQPAPGVSKIPDSTSKASTTSISVKHSSSADTHAVPETELASQTSSCTKQSDKQSPLLGGPSSAKSKQTNISTENEILMFGRNVRPRRDETRSSSISEPWCPPTPPNGAKKRIRLPKGKISDTSTETSSSSSIHSTKSTTSRKSTSTAAVNKATGGSIDEAIGEKILSSDSSESEVEKAVVSEANPTYSPHATAAGRKASGSTARGYSSVALSSAATRRSTVGLFEENDISMDTSQGNSSGGKDSSVIKKGLSRQIAAVTKGQKKEAVDKQKSKWGVIEEVSSDDESDFKSRKAVKSKGILSCGDAGSGADSESESQSDTDSNSAAKMHRKGQLGGNRTASIRMQGDVSHGTTSDIVGGSTIGPVVCPQCRHHIQGAYTSGDPITTGNVSEESNVFISSVDDNDMSTRPKRSGVPSGQFNKATSPIVIGTATAPPNTLPVTASVSAADASTLRTTSTEALFVDTAVDASSCSVPADPRLFSGNNDGAERGNFFNVMGDIPHLEVVKPAQDDECRRHEKTDRIEHPVDTSHVYLKYSRLHHAVRIGEEFQALHIPEVQAHDVKFLDDSCAIADETHVTEKKQLDVNVTRYKADGGRVAVCESVWDIGGIESSKRENQECFDKTSTELSTTGYVCVWSCDRFPIYDDHTVSRYLSEARAVFHSTLCTSPHLLLRHEQKRCAPRWTVDGSFIVVRSDLDAFLLEVLHRRDYNIPKALLALQTRSSIQEGVECWSMVEQLFITNSYHKSGGNVGYICRNLSHRSQRSVMDYLTRFMDLPNYEATEESYPPNTADVASFTSSTSSEVNSSLANPTVTVELSSLCPEEKVNVTGPSSSGMHNESPDISHLPTLGDLADIFTRVESHFGTWAYAQLWNLLYLHNQRVISDSELGHRIVYTLSTAAYLEAGSTSSHAIHSQKASSLSLSSGAFFAATTGTTVHNSAICNHVIAIENSQLQRKVILDLIDLFPREVGSRMNSSTYCFLEMMANPLCDPREAASTA